MNHYHTKIPEYNYRDADDEDWMRFNLEMDKVDWDSILEEQSPEEMTRTFLDKMLEKVSLVFKKLPHFEELKSEENKASSFSSKNKIPRKIRNIM